MTIQSDDTFLKIICRNNFLFRSCIYYIIKPPRKAGIGNTGRVSMHKRLFRTSSSTTPIFKKVSFFHFFEIYSRLKTAQKTLPDIFLNHSKLEKNAVFSTFLNAFAPQKCPNEPSGQPPPPPESDFKNRLHHSRIARTRPMLTRF